MVGFATCVLRETVAGRDGTGQETERHLAYLKGMFHRSESDGGRLLERAIDFARRKGKTVLRVVQYGGGRYFFPGIDLRYEAMLDWLRRMGFERTRILQDVSLDLRAYRPGREPYQRRQWRRLRRAGIRVEAYRPELHEQARAFVAALGIPSWFGPQWEQKWAREGNVVVAVAGRGVLGFSRYHPHWLGPGIGGLGPIGTLQAERGKGVGSCMLDECMRRLKDAGCTTAIANWANTPFYLKNGWQVCREYAVLQKGI